MVKRKQKRHFISKAVDGYFLDVYEAFQFNVRFFREVFVPPFHVRELINQCYEVGLKSLTLITLTGFVTGLVFTKQSRPSLEVFGASSWLPNLISIAIIKALGALVTALICAGKVGSSIGAELGSMRVTEQIDAMEVSAINPFKYLVVTRVLATSLMVPVLTMYCTFVSLMGSFINVTLHEDTSFIAFFENGFAAIQFLDVWAALFKAMLYGYTIGIIGSYKGFYATQGTRGVGRAANKAVVLSMFSVFVEEIVVVQVTNWIKSF